MNGWASQGVELDNQASPGSPLEGISGVVTNMPISRPYRITAGGALYHIVKITASGVTVVGSITAKLQSSIGGSAWVDAKTVTISANGDFYIRLNTQVSGDQGFLPLLNLARIVITTTNAGDAVTISSLYELQER